MEDMEQIRDKIRSTRVFLGCCIGYRLKRARVRIGQKNQTGGYFSNPGETQLWVDQVLPCNCVESEMTISHPMEHGAGNGMDFRH